MADPLVEVVQRFWELERVPDRLPLTAAEQACEANFAATVSRNPEGRYIVHLPFLIESPQLGKSATVALCQFLRLEKRLARQPILRQAYGAFMRDYQDSGHMELVPADADSPVYEPYYIPHHPFHRPDDPPTKLRVVLNASCVSSNGRSLNDLLHAGPKLQADIAALLHRFRLPPIVFTADIRQMYRQIVLRPTHRDYQHIFWRFSSEEPLQTYRLTTVTYGVSAAPFLALRTLRQLAQDEEVSYPAAADVLRESVYVDDILTGAYSPASALALRHQLQQLLTAGGFELRKWASNHPPLLQDLPADHLRTPTHSSSSGASLGIPLSRDPVIKVLGLGWNPTADHFFYAVRLGVPARTKRMILSQMTRIFDPLGWLTPISLRAKLMFRQLCLLQVDWDQALPPSSPGRRLKTNSQNSRASPFRAACVTALRTASRTSLASVMLLRWATPPSSISAALRQPGKRLSPCSAPGRRSLS
ncbi:hypothetical protein KPH14_000904 [Odynerus spinipes]|uniref:Reverse transcriptase domain-containing protein n=1 Tax=Odynerus spinipes TaxID=1348599 RepID=A0AAD9RD65_9HYME|nr:hypothetical protein KPH14_000904 [Odynerus spinipes]